MPVCVRIVNVKTQFDTTQRDGDFFLNNTN